MAGVFNVSGYNTSIKIYTNAASDTQQPAAVRGLCNKR